MTLPATRKIMEIMLEIQSHYGWHCYSKKLFRNLHLFDTGAGIVNFHEHRYKVVNVAGKSVSMWHGGPQPQEGNTLEAEVTVWTNQVGRIIWVNYPEYSCAHFEMNHLRFKNEKPNGIWPGVWPAAAYQTANWRNFTDVKFLLQCNQAEKFRKELIRYRTTYFNMPTEEVKTLIWKKMWEGVSGRRGIGYLCGPSDLGQTGLKELGCKIAHRIPKGRMIADSDHVHENFNWGAKEPEPGQWFPAGSGYNYHGSVGCNAGTVWYSR